MPIFCSGKNGFEINGQHIVSNRKFVEENPAAAKLFEVMRLLVNAVSAQNLKMKEKGTASIRWVGAVGNKSESQIKVAAVQ